MNSMNIMNRKQDMKRDTDTEMVSDTFKLII